MRRRVDTDAESGDDVRGVSSRAAAGVRVAHGSCQRGAGVAKTRVQSGLGRRRRRAAANGVTAGNREGRWSEGNSVINSKFKIPVCKLNFSSYSKGQMKNF